MRIRFHPLFAVYILSLLFLSSWQACVSGILALLIHELGHCAVLLALGYRIRSIHLTPFGGVIEYRQKTEKGIKGIAAAAAGPLSNYAVLLILSVPAVQTSIGNSLFRSAFSANLTLLFLNLLPVLPLDGGRIVLCIGYYVFPVCRLIVWLCRLGTLCGFMMIAMSACGMMVYQVFNCSLFMIGAFLIVWSGYSCDAMLAENRYAVVSERMERAASVRRCSVYHIPANLQTIRLLNLLQQSDEALFLFKDASGTHYIDDHTACRLILEYPGVNIREAYVSQNTKNSTEC